MKVRKLVVTAGPTREKIDPVRFISNYSTGTFGYKIAEAAARRGIATTLVSGPTHLKAPKGVRLINVETAEEMKSQTLKALVRSDCLIMAAAVSDWKPEKPSASKLKKGRGSVSLKMIRNPDILKEASKIKGRILVGFALETEDLIKNAAKKLQEKRMDFIVANRLAGGKNPFGSGKTEVVLIDKIGRMNKYRGMSKDRLTKIIIDKILSFNI